MAARVRAKRREEDEVFVMEARLKLLKEQIRTDLNGMMGDKTTEAYQVLHGSLVAQGIISTSGDISEVPL